MTDIAVAEPFGLDEQRVVIAVDQDVARTVCALHRHGQVYVTHLGDSRAYLIRGEQVRQLTVDHSVAQALVNSGALTEELFARDEVAERPPVTACSDIQKKARELAEALPRQLDADTRATRVSAR